MFENLPLGLSSPTLILDLGIFNRKGLNVYGSKFDYKVFLYIV